MRLTTQSQYLLGDTTPAATFGRVARTIPAPAPLKRSMSEGANDPNLTSRDVADAVARRAASAGGFGDAAVNDSEHRDVPSSDSLHTAARRQRMQLVGAWLASAAKELVVRLRAWREQHRRAAQARATYLALAELDSRTLRDLGIHHHGELRFVAERFARGDALDERRGLR